LHILDTDRLRLRTIDEHDAPFYLQLVNDPGFLQFIGDRKIRTLSAARDAIIDGPMAMQAERGHAIWLVELKASGEPIGMSGLIKRAALPEADIGYAFLPQFTGKGYALEAGAAVLAQARARGMPCLLAITSPDNDASIRLLGKLGLCFEQYKDIGGDNGPVNIYRIDFTAPDATAAE
jgi:RimJ/RimL family protein N-acetyltransferase